MKDGHYLIHFRAEVCEGSIDGNFMAVIKSQKDLNFLLADLMK